MSSELLLDESGWLTEEQLAKRLGLTWGTVKGWRHRGRGPDYYRVGPRAIRYRVEDVERWLKEQQGK